MFHIKYLCSDCTILQYAYENVTLALASQSSNSYSKIVQLESDIHWMYVEYEYENYTPKLSFSIQSCRSCYARLYLCQRPFYKILVKVRNSKKKCT